MAIILKKKKLYNPSRLRKRRNASKKRLTPKQIKFFGTARQRAALKNRGRHKNSVKRSKVRRKNIGEIITLDIAPRRTNSGRGKGMAKYRRTRRANTGTTRRRRRRNVKYVGKIKKGFYKYSNPLRRRRANAGTTRRRRYTRRRANSGVARRRRRINSGYRVARRRRRNSGYQASSRRRRRNSGMRRRRNPAIITNISKAAGIIAGVALTNFALAQVGSMMPALTTGYTSYATGIVLALAEGYVVGKFLKKPDLGEDIAIGGIVLVLIQIINQNFPQFSIGLSGIRGRGGMGLIGNSSFVWPSVLAGPGKYGTFAVAPDYKNFVNAQVSAAVAALPSGKAGMGAIYPSPNGGGRMALRRGVRLN